MAEQKNALLDVDTTNWTHLNSSQQEIFNNARKVINDKLSFNDGRYSMTVTSGKEIGMTERLFTFFVHKMNERNAEFAKIEAKGYVAVEIKKNIIQFVKPKTKVKMSLTASESETAYVTPWGGLTGMVYIDVIEVQVYISYSTLSRINQDYQAYCQDSINHEFDAFTVSSYMDYAPTDFIEQFTEFIKSKTSDQFDTFIQNHQNGIVIQHMSEAKITDDSFSNQKPNTIVWLEYGGYY